MRIPCPHCGTRSHAEFAYLGDAGHTRPTPAEGPPDPTLFVDYVYLRPNPAGWHKEWWQHVGGCRAWLVVERNVTTHEIRGAVPARPSAEAGR